MLRSRLKEVFNGRLHNRRIVILIIVVLLSLNVPELLVVLNVLALEDVGLSALAHTATYLLSLLAVVHHEMLIVMIYNLRVYIV